MDDPRTEAECLLKTGEMYGQRLLLRGVTSGPIFVGFKPGGFSIYFGDAPILHCDREGRWQRAFRDGLHYLKALDASVQTIDRVREGTSLVLKRKTLNQTEVAAIDDWVRLTALELIESLDAGRQTAVLPPEPCLAIDLATLRETLAQVAAWDVSAWSSYRLAYESTYGPFPFLPPDCPAPIVVQATLGDDNASADSPQVRTPSEFESHARAVASLLGRRIEQAKSLFLGGPAVLRQSPADVLAYLAILRDVFPNDPDSPSVAGTPRLTGVHAFLDRFEALPFDRDALDQYRAGGLIRVSLGVDSGDPAIRARFYGKSWTDQDLRSVVSDLKAAGIGVSLIVLVGVGGHSHAAAHLAATSDLLNTLDLGPGDLVSLIDSPEPASPDVIPLSPTDRARQHLLFKDRLSPLRTLRRAKVVSYNPDKQGPSRL